MRIIDYIKTYSDDHTIRYELCASNVSFVHIDGQLNNPAQKTIETTDYESDIDNLYIEKFNGNPLLWKQKIITYREDGIDSKIHYGFTIKVTEQKDPMNIKYECEYIGRESTHHGGIPEMDWQTCLFNEWLTIHCKNHANE